jgi:hypothetical protein
VSVVARFEGFSGAREGRVQEGGVEEFEEED